MADAAAFVRARRLVCHASNDPGQATSVPAATARATGFAGTPRQLPAFTARVDEAGFLVFVFGIWTGFFLSLAVYDWRTRSRVHPVTLTSPAWFAVTWLMSTLT